MCAFTACICFLRRRGPAGLREPILFFLPSYIAPLFALGKERFIRFPHNISLSQSRWPGGRRSIDDIPRPWHKHLYRGFGKQSRPSQ